MASTLLIETYQVVCGVDANDPSPTVLAPGLRTRNIADQCLTFLQGLNNLGALQLPAPTLFVRASPGAQSLALSEPVSQQSLASDLAGVAAQVVIFVRTTQNGVNQSVRLGSIPASLLREVAP